MIILKEVLLHITDLIDHKMEILVTGAAGFIGSHLVRTLLSQNHKVIGIDNFDPFYDKGIKLRNLADMMGHANFSFLEIDICQNDLAANQQLQGNAIGLVIHLAAKAGVLSSIEDIDSYLNTNIIGTKNILEWMRKTGCKKLIFASSSSIYGSHNKPPFAENGNTDYPLTPYASSKKSCELMTYNYHSIFNIDVLNLRLFTVYGPSQRPDLVIHKFAKLIHANQPIRMYGDGNSMRDYTYVSDIVAGFLGSVDYIMNHSDVYESINLGNNHPVKLKEVVTLLYQLLEKPEQIIYEREKRGDMPVTCADITKAQSLLGYQPKVKFQEGLEKFVAWFLQHNVW